jgi:hypothetical protein
MDAFLVFVRYPADDVPMRLCATKSEALEQAHSLTEDEVLGALHAICFGVGGDVTAVFIVEFRGGAPVSTEKVPVEWEWAGLSAAD